MTRRAKLTIGLLAFFVICDGMALYTAYLNRRNKFDSITLSAPAPNFEWQDFGGSSHKLKELTGHVVVVHFWAAWCPPCREEFPKMLKVAQANPDIIFLTIANDNTPDKPMQFVKMSADTSGIQLPPNVLYAWDPKKEITYDLFLTVSYPESIIIDSTQHMRRKYPLPVDWDKPDIRSYLQEVREMK